MAGGCPFSFGRPRPCSFVVQISDQAATSPYLTELDFRITVTNRARFSNQTVMLILIARLLPNPGSIAKSGIKTILAYVS